MMDAYDIEHNLQALGEELQAMRIQNPVELLMIGGGYMLTQLQNRATTNDVDALVLNPDFYSEDYRLFKAAASFVGQDKGLTASWLSTNIGDFLRIAGPLPPMTVWRRFGPLVIYVPRMDFILAHKLVAGREKDIDDIESLRRTLGITTREQAQRILDIYIAQDTQIHHQVDATLDDIFRSS
jgi:hypothetical protein